MIIRPSILCAGLVLLLGSTLVQAHQAAVGVHQHVWRPTTYGKDYRPGHSVNGPTGSITLWSPAAFSGYGAGNSVRFARPVPLNGQPVNQSSQQVQSQSKIHQSNLRQSKKHQSNMPQSNMPQSNMPQSNIPRIKSLAPSRYGKEFKRDYGK